MARFVIVLEDDPTDPDTVMISVMAQGSGGSSSAASAVAKEVLEFISDTSDELQLQSRMIQ